MEYNVTLTLFAAACGAIATVLVEWLTKKLLESKYSKINKDRETAERAEIRAHDEKLSRDILDSISNKLEPISYNLSKQQADLELLKGSNLALTKEALNRLFKYYTEKDENGDYVHKTMSSSDSDIMEKLYSEYRALGGNGTIQHLYEEVKKFISVSVK